MRVAFVLLLLACRASVSIVFAQRDQIYLPGAVQQPAPVRTGKTYPVSGSVFNTVTNAPVARALVSINGMGGTRVAFSGPDGRFQIDNVPEGNVFISAQRPGYFDPSTLVGMGSISTSTKPHVVTSGTNDFRVGLLPEAKLAGKVLDQEGEPVSDLQIELMAQQVFRGRKQLIIRGNASTDDRGEYRFGSQMPGVVAVCMAAKSETPMASHHALGYPARCYPNSPDVQSAQMIELLPGQEAQADLAIAIAPAYQVSGRVVGVSPEQTAAVWLTADNGMQGGPGARVEGGTGRFTLRAVPDGTWIVHTQINQERAPLEAEQEIVVHGADVNGIELRPQAGVDIPVEFTPPGTMAQLHLVAPESGGISIDFGRREYYSTQMPNPSGNNQDPPHFVVQGVPPGQYRIVMQHGNSCLGSVSQGGTDLLREPVNITPGDAPAPIAVSMRSDCASVTASVHGAAGNTITILAVPDDHASDPMPYTTAVSNQSATVTISNLRPGDYHIYAVADMNNLEYMNPAAMRGVPTQTLTLDANQKAAINFDLQGQGSQ